MSTIIIHNHYDTRSDKGVIPFKVTEREKSNNINNEIKQLLYDNFGNYKTSKAITHERKTKRKYYYTLNTKEDILIFVDTLNNNLNKHMLDTFYEKTEIWNTKNNKDKLPLCACYNKKCLKIVILIIQFLRSNFI